jgi:Fe-S-cluster containining protein
MDDATQTFLASLPQIAPGESFRFACHPDVPCFNACCSDLTMPLTPYDVLRLCRGLGMGSEQFLEEFVQVGCSEDTGFPLLRLRMEEGPGRPCPFVAEKGCGVYADRSSACRGYPLGRATRRAEGRTPDAGGADLEERYFLVREEHCRGFAQSRQWTVESWLADQGLEPYNRMNDRYMRLLVRCKDAPGAAPLSGRHATMALLCLYQQDRFLEFLRSMRVLSRVRITGDYGGAGGEEAAQRILDDEETRLLFAFDWLELVIFGDAGNLAPR